jgi:hypothetical protein
MLQNYREQLLKYYSLVGSKIKCDPVNSDLRLLLKESYLETYGDNADISTYDYSFKNVRYGMRKSNEYIENRINYILSVSETDIEAIRYFETMFMDIMTTFEEKLCFISMKETLEFMSDNNQYLDLNFVQIAATKNSEVPCKGWWKCWGKCVASIIGGYYAGGIAGCGVLGGIGGTVGSALEPGAGTVIGALSGCAAGTLLGGLGGALTGAVLGCDQD